MGSLLDTLDTDVSDAQTRLGQAREKMQKLMKQVKKNPRAFGRRMNMGF